VTLPSPAGGVFSGVAVGPGGAFHVAVRYPAAVAPGVFGRLLRIDPASGAVTVVSTLPAPDAGSALSAPAFDAQGRLWVAWVGLRSPTLTVARIAEGAAVETYQAPAPSYGTNGEIQFRASGMWVRMGDAVHRLVGAALVAQPHGVPVLEEGSLVIADDISLDGGRSFYNNTREVFAVEGSPTLLASGNRIMRRHSPAMFAVTGEFWTSFFPRAINRVVATDGGLVALADEWRVSEVGSSVTRLLWHAGAVTDPPFATGPLSETFAGWLTQANALRAQAVLPPLIGDPAISRAAENHSRYWTLNTPTGGLSLHSETPGNPGFTGASASDRCGAAGAPAFCSEVMSSSIAGWVSTAYHRGLIMNPLSLLVGGGVVPGGPTVMNGGEDGNLLVGRAMYPRGAYSGPLSFIGELPDPAAACRASGQQVTLPLGLPVSLWVPGGTLSDYRITPAGGQPLRSCTLPGGLLLPDDALLAGTTYDVSAVWQPTALAAAQPIAWQFSTAPRSTATPPPPPVAPPTPPPPPPAGVIR